MAAEGMTERGALMELFSLQLLKNSGSKITGILDYINYIQLSFCGINLYRRIDAEMATMKTNQLSLLRFLLTANISAKKGNYIKTA